MEGNSDAWWIGDINLVSVPFDAAVKTPILWYRAGIYDFFFLEIRRETWNRVGRPVKEVVLKMFKTLSHFEIFGEVLLSNSNMHEVNFLIMPAEHEPDLNFETVF